MIEKEQGDKNENHGKLLKTTYCTINLIRFRVPPGVLDSLQSTFLPRTTVMVHCYNVLSWLCQVKQREN